MKFVLHFIFTISLSILTIKTDIVVTFFLTIILKLWLDVFVHNLHIDNKKEIHITINNILQSRYK